MIQKEIGCTIILNRYLCASALKVFWKLFRLRIQSIEGVWNFSEYLSVLDKITPVQTDQDDQITDLGHLLHHLVSLLGDHVDVHLRCTPPTRNNTRRLLQ